MDIPKPSFKDCARYPDLTVQCAAAGTFSLRPCTAAGCAAFGPEDAIAGHVFQARAIADHIVPSRAIANHIFLAGAIADYISPAGPIAECIVSAWAITDHIVPVRCCLAAGRCWLAPNNLAQDGSSHRSPAEVGADTASTAEAGASTSAKPPPHGLHLCQGRLLSPARGPQLLLRAGCSVRDVLRR